MPDENETVVIELGHDSRIQLYGQISSRMQKMGFNPCDYGSLVLGIELPADWPCGEKSQPTLAELVVIANKLNMRITIRELFIEPRKKQDGQE